MLADSAARAGFRLDSFDALGSTNEEALRRARDGASGRRWFLAHRQTEGRGRFGRAWASPAGNLHASLLLVDPCGADRLPQLGFVAGVALARAVVNVAGAEAGIRIKWPNDLVRDGAKLAGLLVEVARTPDGGHAAVLGFGVNCASGPSNLRYPTTCLAAITGGPIDPPHLLSVLSETMRDTLDLWAAGMDFPAIRRAWLDLALPVGTALVAQAGPLRVAGRFASIDGRGRLLLDTTDGILPVEAGDVFLTDFERPETFR